MGKGPKTVCGWDKDDIKDNIGKLKDIVLPARFICRKCGRVANDRDYLCKPEKL